MGGERKPRDHYLLGHVHPTVYKDKLRVRWIKEGQDGLKKDKME